MTSNQKALLEDLACIMDKISNECINDDRFDQRIANLNIFNKSLDDASVDIMREVYTDGECEEYIKEG